MYSGFSFAEDTQTMLHSSKLAVLHSKLTIDHTCSNQHKTSSKLGIRLHISIDSKRKFTDELQWLDLQIKTANQLFQAIDVCFQIQAVLPLATKHIVMKSRRQRTALGRTKGALSRGYIDVFIVSQLNDVDRVGEVIRGVHWRDPQDRMFKRWIILSRIARAQVLAHELGHYFSLPHSTYAKSIMNKKPRKTPPYKQRGFVKSELKQMKQAKKQMLRQKFLIAR